MASLADVNEGVTQVLSMCDIPSAAAYNPDTDECYGTKCIDPMFAFLVDIGVNSQLFLFTVTWILEI